MKLIKQISAITLPAATYFSLTLSAFAQNSGSQASSDGTNLNPCQNVGDPWSKLCAQDGSNAGSLISNAILAIFMIATVLALVFLIWGGVKWILSGGDKGKVEAARGTIIAAIVGLIITFLSYFILNLILGIFGISLNNLTLPKITG